MSLLQEALKRKENDEAQHKPEAAGAEKNPSDLPSPAEVSLSLKKPAADNQSADMRQNPPPQSMPVPEHYLDETRQSILAPRSATQASPEAPPRRVALPTLPERFAAASRDGESARLDESAKPVRRKTSLLWAIVAAAAILAGLMIAAGFGFFLYRFLSPIRANISRPIPQAVKVEPVVSGGTNMVAGRTMPGERREAAAAAGAMPSQFAVPDAGKAQKDASATTAPAPAAGMMKVAESNAVQPPSFAETAPRPVSIKPAPVRAKALRATSTAVKWPALKLTGILRGSGPAESTAFINGKMISAGQTIDGVTIVEIQADGVLLKYGAETRFLRVGATLY